MKIKGHHNYTFNKFFQQMNFWGMPVSIYFLFYLNEPKYFLLSLLGILFISKLGHTIGMHRYFCHRSFETSTLKEWMMALLATLSTTSSILYYASVHRYHHRHSDTEQDIHDPKSLGFVKSFFFLIEPKDLPEIPRNMYKDLVQNPRVMFFHNWYWPVILFYVTLLWIVDPHLIVFCYIIPAGYSKFISGIQSTFSHLHGYKNFDTLDNSRNSIFWNWITLGEGLHNNHHYRPNEYSHDYTNKKYEFDISGRIIRYFLMEKTNSAS